MSDSQSLIPTLIERHQPELLADWLKKLPRGSAGGTGQGENETVDQARRFLEQLRRGTRQSEFDDISTATWAPMRELLEDVSRARVAQGFSPSETATFVFSFKEPLF